jgi:hypothetical protein
VPRNTGSLVRISVRFRDRATTICNRVRLKIHLGRRMAPESRTNRKLWTWQHA